MKTAKTTSTKSGFDRRADFQAGSYPAHLLVSDLQLSDEGTDSDIEGNLRHI